MSDKIKLNRDQLDDLLNYIHRSRTIPMAGEECENCGLENLDPMPYAVADLEHRMAKLGGLMNVSTKVLEAEYFVTPKTQALEYGINVL